MPGMMETFTANAAAKINQLQSGDRYTAGRRDAILFSLSKDETLFEPGSDARAVITAHAEKIRTAAFPSASIVEQNGDVGFFVVQAAPFIQRQKFRDLIEKHYDSPFAYNEEKKKRALDFLERTDLLEKDKLIIGMIETAIEGEEMPSWHVRGYVDDCMKLWQYALTGKRPGYEFMDEMDERDRRFAGSLVRKFSDAVHAIVQESEDQFDKGRGATLKRGQAGLMRSFLRNSRVRLKDINQEDFNAAVRDIVRTEGWRWHSQPENDAIIDASNLMWEALKKLRDQDEAWHSHRRCSAKNNAPAARL